MRKNYPIFTRTLVVVIPSCVAVPVAGLFVGFVIAVVVASLVVGQS